MDTANGSCLCGEVALVLTFSSKWVAHCQPSSCRRAHGAAYVTWVGMPAGDVAIVDPQSRLRRYASSPGAGRGFSSRCGSTLFFRSSRWPGELHVAHANLHDAADRGPQAHAYWDTHVAWASIDPDDGLKRIADPKSTPG